MKLTKFVHSCVLAEHEGKTALFDPGIFSWNSGLVDVSTLPRLDTIVVSHKHADHCAEPFVRELAKTFPEAEWFAPSDAHDVLKNWGVQHVTNQSHGDILAAEENHAMVEPFAEQVLNLACHWNGVVTHPGDIHTFEGTKDVLLLPVQAPWGTTIRAVQLALELKPKYILPIHDWMWNDDWRQTCYDRFEQLFSQNNITFLRPTNGQSLEVDL
jgi:L-ascorbate metabolism protein UlaG (beta-lactamase superfamily)